MDDFSDAFEGAIALVCGGFIFLLFARTFPTGSLINFSLWGVVFIAIGSVLAVVLVSALFAKVVSRVA